MATFVYLPIPSQEMLEAAERWNQGRLQKVVDGQISNVTNEPTLIFSNVVGVTGFTISATPESQSEGMIKVDGIHKDFLRINPMGASFTIPKRRIKKVWAKSESQNDPAILHFGVAKEPYQILTPPLQGPWKGVKRAFGFGALRNVRTSDKLYILAHGLHNQEDDFGAQKVGVKRGAIKEESFPKPKWNGGIMKSYTAQELALVLKDEGLTTDFKELHLFACGGGIDQAAERRSFAQQLKETMRDEYEYTQLIVYGYLGDLSSDYNHQKLPPQERMLDKHNEGLQFEEHSTQKGLTATLHKGVTIQGQIYPARAYRVMF